MASISFPSHPIANRALTGFPSPTRYSFRRLRRLEKQKNLSCTQALTLSNSPSSISSSTYPSSSSSSIATTRPTSLSHIWRELQGSNNWENLVDPFHPLLRQEVIRYAELTMACYTALDLNNNSPRYSKCKYPKHTILERVGLGNSGYEVTKYVYVTHEKDTNVQNGILEHTCSPWIGYVAVSSDESTRNNLGRRDILIAFRGTVTPHEWKTNFQSSLIPARLHPLDPQPDVKVESGFLSLYTSEGCESKFGLKSCREQLLFELTRLLNVYKDEETSITLTGHSMGSSLALLLAYDITGLGLTDQKNLKEEIPVTVFSFAGPRVGNLRFKERCEELGVKVLRIVNVNDPFTKIPGVFFNENFMFMGRKFELSFNRYFHVGVELQLDCLNMIMNLNPIFVHDINTYINLLRSSTEGDIYVGDDEENNNEVVGLDIGVDIFFNKAKELVSNAQNLNMFPWKIGSDSVNIVESQRVESNFSRDFVLKIEDEEHDPDEEEFERVLKSIGIFAEEPTSNYHDWVKNKLVVCGLIAGSSCGISFLLNNIYP